MFMRIYRFLQSSKPLSLCCGPEVSSLTQSTSRLPAWRHRGASWGPAAGGETARGTCCRLKYSTASTSGMLSWNLSRKLILLCLTCGCLQSLLSWFHASLPPNYQRRLRWLRHCKWRWRAGGVPGAAPPPQQGRACAHGRRGRGGGAAAAWQDQPGGPEGDDIV